MNLQQIRSRLASGDSLATAVAAQGSQLDLAGLLDQRSAAATRLLGAGELEALLQESGVTDVVVHAGRVWVDRGAGMVDSGLDLGGEHAVRALAVRLAALAGQRLDDAAPIVDGVLPSGVRLHAVLPPLAADGTSISLRTHRQHTLTLGELERSGALGPGIATAVRALLLGRANCVIAGATGTGKTTLLSALLAELPAEERVVCIEEVRELEPSHPHIAHLQARAANVQAAGAVGLEALVRAALRMRPDRVVLGEARGGEIREVLAALNTGHAGSWFTLHANSVGDIPARLVALGALAGMSPEMVVLQAAAALDAVVFLRRENGVRTVAQVAAFRPSKSGDLQAVPVITRVAGQEQQVGEHWDEFAARWM